MVTYLQFSPRRAPDPPTSCLERRAKSVSSERSCPMADEDGFPCKPLASTYMHTLVHTYSYTCSHIHINVHMKWESN